MGLFGNNEKTTIGIEGMSCQHCVKSVTDGLKELPGVKKVKVSLEDKNAEVTYDKDKISLDDIKKEVEEIGFQVV